MKSTVLLAQLRSLLETVPDFETYSPTSAEHQRWLANAHALVGRWNAAEAFAIASASDFMHMPLLRDGQTAKIFAIVHRAIANLEADEPPIPDRVFAPGAVYDFFKALSEVLGSATTSVFVIDPYLDDEIFDAYLSNSPVGISTRLLTKKHGGRLKPALQRFSAQHGNEIAVRISPLLHDRVLFVDDLSCWVLGQSIKDAAKTTPTYLSPLAADVAQQKRLHYETIWEAATDLLSIGFPSTE